MYEENAVLHALGTRRSVRSYDSTKPVEQEKIQAVLTAGQYAPTGMNRMPYFPYFLTSRFSLPF